jgi:hypothetical protein
MEVIMKSNENVLWQSWTIGILGVWLMVAAFLEFDPVANLWNNLIVGIIVAFVGYGIVKQKPWQSWTSMVMGVWLIIAAFIPYLLVDKGYVWNDFISGIIITVAGFGALSKSEKASHAL